MGWADYGARIYDGQIGRWHVSDPHSESYTTLSPYSFSNNNPITFVDLDGKDWFYYKQAGASDAGWHWQEGHEYTFNTKDAKNKAVSQKLTGVEAVVVFAGSRTESLGPGSNIKTAQGATVTVYGPNGADDVSQYRGYTMTSNAAKFGAIDEGDYSGNYMDPGKGGPLSSHWALNGTGSVRMMDGNINPFQPSQIDENGEGYKNGIYIHRPNKSGYAGEVENGANGISVGCLLIDPRDWSSFNKSMSGMKDFRVQVQREVSRTVPTPASWSNSVFSWSLFMNMPKNNAFRIPMPVPSMRVNYLKKD
ncbi:RHS repeat-associated core domain-containing protein [Mucilaginibacter sp.]|uniref:RHS repeat-associated core domain-containing protein n=1 Tax=Mucilaginibacter sp. TaxID=1882438 RepID=UPI00374D6C4C